MSIATWVDMVVCGACAFFVGVYVGGVMMVIIEQRATRAVNERRLREAERRAFMLDD